MPKILSDMTKSKRSRIGFVFVCLCVVFIGVFLRLYNKENSTHFMGDQGALLGVANNIITQGKYPLVGPIVTAENFLIPPFNYYLVALFLLFTKSPLDIVLWYTAMNVIAMILLAKLAAERIDKTAGVITLVLFAISNVMVAHGRSMWEPHPITFFICASLFFLHRAWRDGRLLLLLLSVGLYGLAMGTYVTSYLLFPFYVAHVFLWFQKIEKQSLKTSLLSTVSLFGFLCGVVFYSQYVYEIFNKFPTLTALRSANFAVPSLMAGVSKFINLFFLLVTDVFQSNFMTIPMWHIRPVYPIVGLLILARYLAMREDTVYTRAAIRLERFVKIPILLLGMSAMLSYTQRNYAYRLNVFIPFVILVLASLARASFGSKFTISRALMILILGLYVVGNTTAWFYTTLWSPRLDFPKASRITSYVRQDVYANQLKLNEFAVHVYSPADKSDYDATQIWYQLYLLGLYTQDVQARGNDISRNRLETSAVRSYLACRGFYSYEDALAQCVGEYLRLNPSYGIRRATVFPTDILFFVLDREI